MLPRVASDQHAIDPVGSADTHLELVALCAPSAITPEFPDRCHGTVAFDMHRDAADAQRRKPRRRSGTLRGAAKRALPLIDGRHDAREVPFAAIVASDHR